MVAQRLARTVCPHCGTKYFASEDAVADALAGLPPASPERTALLSGRPLLKGAGCSKCHNSGMLGRSGVYEVMEVGPVVRRLVHRAAAAHELRDAWQRDGGKTLRHEGVRLALSGACSLEEVLRVTQQDEVLDGAAPAPAPASAPAPEPAPAHSSGVAA